MHSRPTGNRLKLVDRREYANSRVTLTSNDSGYSYWSDSVGVSNDFVDIPVSLDYTRKVISPVITEEYRPFLWVYPKPFERQGYSTYRKSGVFTSIPDRYTVQGEPPFSHDLLRDTWPLVYPTTTDMFEHYLKFNKKLSNSKVDVLTTLAEARSTFSMLGNAAYSLFTLYRGVRKADSKLISEALAGRKFKGRKDRNLVSQNWKNKTAQNRWLELQYGWLPMIADIKTAFKEMSTLPEADLIKFTHSDKIQRAARFTSGGRAGMSGTENMIIKTSCYYVQDSKNLRKAAQWNLGINPLLTAWELVPYSFVIDWFIPIGDFLSQFSASAGLRFISGTTVSYCTYTCEQTKDESVGVTVSGMTRRCYYTNVYEQKGFCVRRKVLTASPVGLPTFSFNISGKRAVNALALITQRIK